MNGKGRGYWGVGINTPYKWYRNENGEWEHIEEQWSWTYSDGDNVLPLLIDNKKPYFYKLDLRVYDSCHIVINDEFLIAVTDTFNINENDLSIHSLQILEKGVRYYVQGAYF